MSFLYPVFYGTPVQLHCNQGWVSGRNVVRNQRDASWFVFLAPLPIDHNEDPQLVSYGDTCSLALLPRWEIVGLEATTQRIWIGPKPSVQPLAFSVQPASGQPAGQPLTALDQLNQKTGPPQTNQIFLQTSTWGTVFVKGNKELGLSLVRATSFHVVVASSQRKSTISLPLAYPPANTVPPKARNIPVWYEPFMPLMPVPAIMPMFASDSSLQMSSTEPPLPGNIICLFGRSFCLPKWLAMTVVIFALLTLLVFVASKSVD